MGDSSGTVLRSCLKKPGTKSTKKHLPLTFGNITLVDSDNQIYEVDLPETIDLYDPESDLRLLADTEESEESNPTPDLVCDDDTTTGEKVKSKEKQKEIKEKERREKKEAKEKQKAKESKKKEKPSSKKSKKTNQAEEAQEQKSSPGAKPERNLDRTGKVISDWLQKLFASETLPTNFAEILKNLFQLPNSRAYFTEFLNERTTNRQAPVIELQKQYFSQFTEICCVFLVASFECKDFESIALFCPYLRSFKETNDSCGDFMFIEMQDLPVWDEETVWKEACKILNNLYKLKKEPDPAFLALSELIILMQDVCVPVSEIKKFLQSQFKLYKLSSEQKDELMNSIVEKPKRKRVVSVLGPAQVSPEFVHTRSPQPTRRKKNGTEIPSSGGTPTFDLKATLTGHKKKGRVTAAALDYPNLVSGSVTGQILLYDIKAQSYSTISLEKHTKRVSGLVVTKEFIISSSNDSHIIVWCIKTGKILHDIVGHSGVINNIELYGNLLLSVSADKTVRVSDVYTGDSVELQQHTDSVTCGIWINDKTFVSTSKDQTICIWENGANQWQLKFKLMGHDDKINCIDADTTRGIIVSGSNDTTLRSWSYSTGEVLRVFKGHTGPITSLELCDKLVASGSSDCSVRLWNIDYGHQIHVFQQKNMGIITTVQLSHEFVIAGDYDNSIRVWHCESKKLLKTLKGHKDSIEFLKLHEIEDGDEYFPLLISGSGDCTVKLWEPKRKKKKKGKK